jgi:hypothetical protein
MRLVARSRDAGEADEVARALGDADRRGYKVRYLRKTYCVRKVRNF